MGFNNYYSSEFQSIKGHVPEESLVFLSDMVMWWNARITTERPRLHYKILPPWWNHNGMLMLSNPYCGDTEAEWSDQYIAIKDDIPFILSNDHYRNTFGLDYIDGYYSDFESLIKGLIVSMAIWALGTRLGKNLIIELTDAGCAPGWREEEIDLGLDPCSQNLAYVNNANPALWVSTGEDDCTGVIATHFLGMSFQELDDYFTQGMSPEAKNPTWPPQFETMPYPEHIDRIGHEGFYNTEFLASTLNTRTLDYVVPQTWTNLPAPETPQ